MWIRVRRISHRMTKEVATSSEGESLKRSIDLDDLGRNDVYAFD